MLEFIQKNKYLVLVVIVFIIFSIGLSYFIFSKSEPTQNMVSELPSKLKIKLENIKFNIEKLKEYDRPKGGKKIFEAKSNGSKIIYEMVPISNSSNFNLNVVLNLNSKLYLLNQELVTGPSEQSNPEMDMGGIRYRYGKDLYTSDSFRITWDIIDQYFSNKLIVKNIKSYSSQVVAGIIYHIVFTAIDLNNRDHEINATVMELVNGKKNIILN